ncbi:MAG: ABC transporter permease [Bacteroidales bacterium]
MMKNYINIALRNYWKNRVYTLINVLGLSVGIACFIGIVAYANNELSYDRHHSDAARIFRVKLKGEMSGTFFEAAVTGAPVGEILYNELPEVIMFTHFIQYSRSVLFDYNNSKIYQEGILYADSSFFDMFSYDVVGDSKTALQEPYSLVMLESVARKYFGNENPIGKIIKWDNKSDYTVLAVIKEPLKNSHIGFEVLVSRSSLFSDPRYSSVYNNLFAFTNFNYLKCTTSDVANLNVKVNDTFQRHVSVQSKESGSKLAIELQPITDIYLKSNITHEIKQNGNVTTVYIFMVVAILIVVISSINYINLAMANSSTRISEIGLKKVFGVRKFSLFFQFLGESAVLVVVSFILGLIILRLIAPLFNVISTQPFLNILSDNVNWLGLLILIPVISILAGAYPSFYLSSLKPVRILKGNFGSGRESLFFRNFMVVVQFVISIFLLSSTWLIHNQISFIGNKDLGFEKENTLILSLRNVDMIRKYGTLKNELLELPDVLAVGASSSYVGSFNQRRGFYREGYSRKDMMMILNLQCDGDFLTTMGIEMMQGRNFFLAGEGDNDKIIVNETLVREFGIVDPIGKAFRLPGTGEEPDDLKLEIVGVCKDFNYASLHNAVKPIIVWKDQSAGRYVSVKIRGANRASAIDAISSQWSNVYPDYPFEYFFLDERYGSDYRADVNTSRVFLMFTILAIFIACLGVFGLTSYAVQRRTKEIGIRKVSGSGISGIMILISKDYVVPIIVSAVVSLPAAWYFINKWLHGFSYHVDIQWFVFAVAPIIAFAIALIAVNVKAYAAAKRNPVEVIRYE